MIDSVRTLLLLAGGVCFILGLKQMGRPATARRANLLSAVGMSCAMVGTALEVAHFPGGFGKWVPMLAGLLVGSAIGLPLAYRIQMTQMPEMVGLLNGFGGLASLCAGWSQMIRWRGHAEDLPLGMAGMPAASAFLAVLIGGVTFTGSLIAFAKLAQKFGISGKPILFKNQNLVNGLVVGVLLLGCVWFTRSPDHYWLFLLAVPLALYLGVAVTIPIGGADMPVVISLMNSYSGLAACAAGFAVGENLLIVTGALVGASGIVLTKIMCKAMNRSLGNVLFSGFGAAEGATAAATGEKREAKSMTPADAYFVLEAARQIVFVPGYGMAVAQAQHAVHELAQAFEANGAEVKFAIHPVAGRMPGHMNVLLAEANVPYEQLVEMDAINPQMDSVDVAIVIGANDVVNPAAKEDPKSPIAGMPIIECHRARTVFVLKRSMASGFAGIENPLFFKDNAYMIFGDAKKTVEALVGEFKEAAAAA
jgi:NAD(P) transhydrogenase subunit beta